MKGMIFAAGLGTRLKPLTDHLPKALVCLGDKTLLERQIDFLVEQGIDEIIINIHHFPELMQKHIRHYAKKNAKLYVSDESDLLLDTGGGLRKAASLLQSEEPVLLINVDIICNFPLRSMMEAHRHSGAACTLAVTRRASARNLLFDNQFRLCGWENRKTGEQIIFTPGEHLSYAFSGIHLINPELFELLPDQDVFSIIDFYLKIGSYTKIYGFQHEEAGWFDLGDTEKLKKAAHYYGL